MAIVDAFNSEGGTGAIGGAVQKDLSNQTDGSKTTFSTPEKFVQNSLVVYWNGLRQFTGVTITINSNQSFTTSFIAESDDYLFVEYNKL